MTKFLSAEFIRQKIGGHGYRRAEKILQTVGQEPDPPRENLPTKVGANFCVINYGLKSVAWFAFAEPLTVHATGFNQWLMTKFLSAEFIRRLGGRTF